MQTWVDNISAQFAKEGLRKGDRVAIWLPSSVEGVACFLACSRNGYVACSSLHQNYTIQEIGEFIKRSRAAILVMMPEYGSNKSPADLIHLATELPDLKQTIAINDT